MSSLRTQILWCRAKMDIHHKNNVRNAIFYIIIRYRFWVKSSIASIYTWSGAALMKLGINFSCRPLEFDIRVINVCGNFGLWWSICHIRQPQCHVVSSSFWWSATKGNKLSSWLQLESLIRYPTCRLMGHVCRDAPRRLVCERDHLAGEIIGNHIGV